MTTNPHVSALALDALALGALDREAEARLQQHLASCAACRDEQTAAAALRDQFTRNVLPRGLPTRPRPCWWWLAVPALAMLAVFVLWRRPSPVADFGIKGDASWQVFANRGGEPFAVHDGSRLASGDRIRFLVLSAGAPYLMVASVDGSGAATIYYPYEGAHSAAVDREQVEPPGSIVLDAAPGPERLYALLSDQPLAAEDVKARLREVAAGGPDAIRASSALPLAMRAQLSLVFEKDAP